MDIGRDKMLHRLEQRRLKYVNLCTFGHLLQGCTNFQKFQQLPETFRPPEAQHEQVQQEDPHILGATIQNSVATETWCPGNFHV